MISQNKNVNRLFLAVVVIYIGVSFGFGFLPAIIPALSELPMYVSLLLSQSLIFVPCFVYCRWKHIKIREFIPYRKIGIITIILVVICTYLMYPLIIVLNAVSMLFSNSGTASVMGLMQLVWRNLWSEESCFRLIGKVKCCQQFFSVHFCLDVCI